MRSGLYECTITHTRTGERAHQFSYRVFAFALDLAEIDQVAARVPWFSRNRFNLFAYYDRDHIDIRALLRASNIEQVSRVVLITNLRIAGYVFNPVSFYFCFDGHDAPCAAVVEVNNTFGETKTWILNGPDTFANGQFESTQPKYFYVSPFVELDIDFRMRLAVPDDRLGIVIDDLRGEERILRAAFTGKRAELTATRLLWFAVKYPFLTVKVILAIHWQAFRLWLKGVPFIRKSEHGDLQRGIHGVVR